MSTGASTTDLILMAETSKPRILLLDDEQDLLDLYRGIFEGLTCVPEVFSTDSGARAVTMLETQEFDLLISDLSMPKMDGLQVMSIVRRRFPNLRTAILTSVTDEQFRARAYSIGVDLFLEKPSTKQEVKLLCDCVESLLHRDRHEGFRGVQSKSLVDLIQMESLSQSSSVLKVTNGRLEGKIWFLNGDIVDAEDGERRGEEAFMKILSWKQGSFESLPAEAGRKRRIFTSSHALLLDAAQSSDESSAGVGEFGDDLSELDLDALESLSSVSHVTKKRGVEFVVSLDNRIPEGFETWGIENDGEMTSWVKSFSSELAAIGESLNLGILESAQATGLQRNVGFEFRSCGELCVAFHRALSIGEVKEIMDEIRLEEVC